MPVLLKPIEISFGLEPVLGGRSISYCAIVIIVIVARCALATKSVKILL